MLVNNTPIEEYDLQGTTVFVKREDLSCPLPGPPFSKMRGVVEHITARPESVIGVLDTYHSKAGWAVAYACKHLGKQCINYYPVYKAEIDNGSGIRFPQIQSEGLGASLRGLTAGRSAILFHRAKKELTKEFPSSYLMPNALKLNESVTTTATELEYSADKIRDIDPAHVVVSISSATIAAGVIMGLNRIKLKKDPIVWLHEGYSRSEKAIFAYLKSMVGEDLLAQGGDVRVIDENYEYKDTAPKTASAPFPCNPHYDLKTWHWLGKHLATGNDLAGVPGNILFWNVGD